MSFVQFPEMTGENPPYWYHFTIDKNAVRVHFSQCAWKFIFGRFQQCLQGSSRTLIRLSSRARTVIASGSDTNPVLSIPFADPSVGLELFTFAVNILTTQDCVSEYSDQMKTQAVWIDAIGRAQHGSSLRIVLTQEISAFLFAINQATVNRINKSIREAYKRQYQHDALLIYGVIIAENYVRFSLGKDCACVAGNRDDEAEAFVLNSHNLLLPNHACFALAALAIVEEEFRQQRYE
jgi:hypothetical protein